MKKNLTLILILLYNIVLYSQNVHTAIEKINRSMGLSNSNVLSIVQDKFGFMWFATEGGLNRFDGSQFIAYKHNNENPKSIACNTINKLLIDNEGILWIATTHEGLDRYNHESDDFTHFYPNGKPGDISGPAITDLCLSHTGNIWVATYFNGLNLLDKKSQKFTHYSYDVNNENTIREDIVLKIHEDRQHFLWIGYRSQGLSVMNTQTGEMKHYLHDSQNPQSLPSNTILAITQDQYNNIWIGTDNGLCLYNKIEDNFIVFTHDPSNRNSIISNKIMDIHEMKDGKIWIGTENGGISILNISFPIMDFKKIKFQNLHSGDSKDELSHNSVYSLYQDCYENIWIGTFGGGINFISKYPNAFNTIEYSPYSQGSKSLSYRTPWGLCESPDGRIWIGTDGGGINILNPQVGIEKVLNSTNSPIRDNAILCAYTDHQNRLWFGTYQGGAFYFGPTRQFVQINHLPSNDVRVIFESSDHKMLIGTMEGLANINEKGELIKILQDSDGLSNNNCSAIAEDANHNFWIGHHGNGITVLDNSFQVLKKYSTQRGNTKSLIDNTVFCILCDKNNNIWVGTGNGLNLYNPQTDDFSHFTTNEGLADNTIRALVEDKSGYLWMSTNDGISRMHIKTQQIYNYNYREGVPFGEFMDNSVLYSQSGLIYFRSRNGLCYFSPDQLLENIAPPTVCFTHLEIYNEIVEPNQDGPLPRNIIYQDPLSLSFDQNVFTIHYSVTNYALQKKTIYRYKLEGFDSDWVTNDEQGNVSYKKIPAGKYKFMVETSLDNKTWSSPTQLSIIVRPPFWRTWWMKIIYTLFFVLSIFYLYTYYKKRNKIKQELIVKRLQIKESEEINKAKLQFFTNISHEIKTPLTLIISPLEDILKNETNPVNKKRLQIISNNANLLLKLFNRLLDFRKIENGHSKLYLTKGNIIRTISDVCISYKELKADSKIKFSYHTEVANLTIWYDHEKIFSIIDNLLSNAYKYTTSGQISVIVKLIESQPGNSVQIQVTDTGIGIDKEAQAHIFDRFYQVKNATSSSGTGIGLSLVYNFVSLHHGQISVNSEKGKGSTFTVAIPCTLSPSEPLEPVEVESSNDDTIKEDEMSKKILLIVDDNKDIRDYIYSCFENEFKILSAENAEDALNMAQKQLPDIIISDVMMDGISGIELCRKIKQNEDTNHIPIILLTAKSSPFDKKEGYDAGADSYITKPFYSEILKTRVHNLIAAREKFREYISKALFNGQNQRQDVEKVRQNTLIKSLTQIIEDNMSDERLDIEFLSSNLCMSHSSLFRKVKALTGLSINEFVRGIRMEKAEAYLKTGEYSISEVAYKVGFNSLRYFRQCFKNHFGANPSDYLQNRKDSNNTI